MVLSLRQRLTRQAARAILALIIGFVIMTVVAASIHLYSISRADAQALARHVLEHSSDRLDRYQTRTDPVVWMTSRGRPPYVSPNAPRSRPLAPGIVGLYGARPLLVVRAPSDHRVVTVGWPLSTDLDLLQDLVVVLAIVGAGAGAAGIWLARWATHRMLGPVDIMTRAVHQMVEQERVQDLPEISDVDDEFNRLRTVLNQLLWKLERQAGRERQMLSQAAHELRTPLQVLQGNLDLLGDWNEVAPAVRHESVHQSRLVLKRLVHWVSEVMTLERAASMEVVSEPVELVALVTAMAQDAQALAPKLTIELVGGAQQMSVLANSWSVERALWAVMDNALKYTSPGGQVQLAIHTTPTQGGVVVADTGPGIAERDLPYVFDRFYRGKDGQGVPGSGLGLAIANALVHRHHGGIRLESKPGAGTRVELWWPRCQGTPTIN